MNPLKIKIINKPVGGLNYWYLVNSILITYYKAPKMNDFSNYFVAFFFSFFFGEVGGYLSKLLPGLIKSERPKSISFMSASSLLEVKRKFC